MEKYHLNDTIDYFTESFYQNLFQYFIIFVIVSIIGGVILLCLYFVYIALFRDDYRLLVDKTKNLPPLPQMNLTLEQLKQYNGEGADGRVCIAMLRKIYDITKGKSSYLFKFNILKCIFS